MIGKPWPTACVLIVITSATIALSPWAMHIGAYLVVCMLAVIGVQLWWPTRGGQ
jgi:hypothetical protein